MTKNTKYIIAGVSIIAVSAFAYFYYFGIDKDMAVKILNKNGLTNGYTQSAITALPDEMLVNWAKAVRLLQKKFTYNGKEYSTNTGASI